MSVDNTYKVYRYWGPTGKSYIGQTNQTLAARSGSRGQQYWASTHFYYAIQKYGFEWFKNHREILAKNLTKEEADRLEKFYIEQYDSIENGYNIQTGGTFDPSEIHHREIVGIKCFTKEVQKFYSIAEASRETGVNRRSINKVINKENPTGKTMGGYVWCDLDEWNSLSKEEQERMKNIVPKIKNIPRKVICLNNGCIYESIKEAEIENNCSNISACCRKKIKTAGKVNGSPGIWCYYDEWEAENNVDENISE